MSFADKLKHKAEEALGKGKAKTGQATDDKSLQAEGEKDQSKANLKQAGDNVKDAFRKE
ncbi:MAG: CsbD family protein [Nocardioidaceae bacterium]